MALVRAVDGVCVPGAKPGRQEHRSAGQGEALSTDERSRARRFEEIFATHLDAAYNYAHWLTRDARNAEDVVQEACLRAFKFLDSFHGESGRAWLLAIVRQRFPGLQLLVRAHSRTDAYEYAELGVPAVREEL